MVQPVSRGRVVGARVAVGVWAVSGVAAFWVSVWGFFTGQFHGATVFPLLIVMFVAMSASAALRGGANSAVRRF